MIRWILLVLGLFLASPSLAATEWIGSTTIHSGQLSSWTFENADGTGTADSPAFIVRSPTALICFDPDTGGTGGTGQVTPRRCLDNVLPGTAPNNSCISIGLLIGTEGAASAQNACVRVGPGTYYIDVTTVCNTDDCRVDIMGEY